MRVFFSKLIKLSGLFLILYVACGFLPIRIKYIYECLLDTQYEKVVWIHNALENNKLQSNYNTVFFGSSQCLYSINDSILGNDYLNLGVNTPSRDLDLYWVEELELRGIEVEKYCQVIGEQGAIAFGTHKVMPFLVTPFWYLEHGQSVFSIHFWRFCFLRSSKVIMSYLETSDAHFQIESRFGVRYLYDSMGSIPEKYEIGSDHGCSANYSFWDEFRYNRRSQKKFFLKFREGRDCLYLIHPSLNSNQNYNSLVKNYMADCGIPIISFDEEERQELQSLNYWSDNGHLNKEGSILMSNFLKNKLDR